MIRAILLQRGSRQGSASSRIVLPPILVCGGQHSAQGAGHGFISIRVLSHFTKSMRSLFGDRLRKSANDFVGYFIKSFPISQFGNSPSRYENQRSNDRRVNCALCLGNIAR